MCLMGFKVKGSHNYIGQIGLLEILYEGWLRSCVTVDEYLYECDVTCDITRSNSAKRYTIIWGVFQKNPCEGHISSSTQRLTMILVWVDRPAFWLSGNVRKKLKNQKIQSAEWCRFLNLILPYSRLVFQKMSPAGHGGRDNLSTT